MSLPNAKALPETMRQIRFVGAGGPEVIALEQAALPVPAAGQVLVRVAFAGVNRPDCLQREGSYAPPPGATEIPGLEIAGEIVALGPESGSLAIGQKIAALVAGGGYAEYCLVDAPLAMPIPKGLSLIEAAALPENVLTVYDNIVTRGHLTEGERFLVHGGTSGIGSIAIQMAKAFGAKVFSTARGPDKVQFCRELGADVAIDYAAEDFVARVLTETEKKGVDVILDMVGGDYIPRNLRCLGMDGRIVQIAFLRGSKAEVDLRHLMVKRQTYTGSTLRPRSVKQKAAIVKAVLAEVWPQIEAGAIRPKIDTIYPLAETRAAHERMESSAHSGKLMLKMD